MKILGLDFDNTLVDYNNLFHKIALEKQLIKKDTPANKVIIRDYLRSVNKESEFTILQGEVYGLRILEANDSPEMIKTLNALNKKGVKMYLVSHKTQFPYKGPKYDLRDAALKWLEAKGFFEKNGLNWHMSQIHFESTKEEKIRKIVELGCTHYIDDLPEILTMLPNHIKKIHFNPYVSNTKHEFQQLKCWSKLKNGI